MNKISRHVSFIRPLKIKLYSDEKLFFSQYLLPPHFKNIIKAVSQYSGQQLRRIPLLTSGFRILFTCLLFLVSFLGCSLVDFEEGIGKRYALIYGFNNGSLSYASDDAVGIGNILSQHGYQITLRADTTASRDAILNDLDNMVVNLNNEDILFFYFTGHGDSQSMLVYDGIIQIDEINERVSRLQSDKVVLVFDHCYSGSHIAQATKRVVLTASTENEFSWEFGNPVNHGIFTYYLIKGLSNNNADTNGDRSVSLSELYYYSYERVVTFTTTNSSPQHPQFLGNKNLELILY